MELLELCKKIEIPQDILGLILKEEKECTYSVEELFYNLGNKEREGDFRENLKYDEKGLKILTYMLMAGLKTKELYSKKSINERIYYDTFKAFSRFVNEHFISYGSYGFDRAWWTYRQVGMKLFRLGELEYEIKELNNETVVSIHIPSDANLKHDLCMESYAKAKEFFSTYYPEYTLNKYICNSWLLSDALDKLLPADSNISKFKSNFEIQFVNYEAMDFLEWVYKRMDIPLEQLPEDTTLQRNLKKHLLSGGKVGSAFGILKI